MIALNKTGSVIILDEEDREIENYKIVVGSLVTKADGETIEKGETLAMWDPHNVPIISEKAGRIAFRDIIPVLPSSATWMRPPVVLPPLWLSTRTT